jgi:DnaK suppressor protein
MKNTLSPTEAEPFRARLQAMRRYIDPARFRNELVGLSDAARATADAVDAISMNEFADVIGMISQSTGETLSQIKSALERIDNGTYGACEECENKIPKSRLEALPQTPYCIACQRRIESGANGVRKKVRGALEESDPD